MFKGIDLSDGSFNSFAILMRPDTLQNSVILVRENDIALWIEFKDEMIWEGLRTKCENHNSFNTHLLDSLNSLGSEIFSKSHGKSWRDMFFVRKGLGDVESDSVLNKQ